MKLTGFTVSLNSSHAKDLVEPLPSWHVPSGLRLVPARTLEPKVNEQEQRVIEPMSVENGFGQCLLDE